MGARAAAQAGAQQWRNERKIAALTAAGATRVQERAAAADKLAAYLKNQREVAMLGEWQTADGEPLCILKPGGDVAVLPSKGEGGAWKVVAEDDFSSTVEITLRLNRFTPRGVYSGAQEHTLRGTVRGNDFDGTISIVLFGQEADSNWSMQKS